MGEGGEYVRGYLVHTLTFVHVFSAFFNLCYTIVFLLEKVRLYAYQQGGRREKNWLLNWTYCMTILHCIYVNFRFCKYQYSCDSVIGDTAHYCHAGLQGSKVITPQTHLVAMTKHRVNTTHTHNWNVHDTASYLISNQPCTMTVPAVHSLQLADKLALHTE